MREQRKEPRKRTKEWAKIVLLDLETVFNCTIVDISTSGASIRIGDARVPDTFYFYRKADCTVRSASVRNRRFGAIGIEFLEQFPSDSEIAMKTLSAIAESRSKPMRRPPRRSDGREIFTFHVR